MKPTLKKKKQHGIIKLKKKINVKNINPKKTTMLTRVKFLNLQLGSRNQDHPLEKKTWSPIPNQPYVEG
jgi:hypothetical protein